MFYVKEYLYFNEMPDYSHCIKMIGYKMVLEIMCGCNIIRRSYEKAHNFLFNAVHMCSALHGIRTRCHTACNCRIYK